MADYSNIKLEKGMYTAKGGFSAALEELDPSENYEGTPLGKLDAFQRQLKRFDIRISGPNSDTVEKFFSTGDAPALFPEYIARAVRTGMEEADRLSSVVAATTRINSQDYRSFTSEPTDAAKSLNPVAEGGQIPETNITVNSKVVSLQKRGRVLSASYESLRFQRLDVFTVMLRQIGAHIARSRFADAVDVLLNGDGNSNPAPQTQAGGEDLAYSDLVGLFTGMMPYRLTAMCVSPSAAAALLTLPELSDHNAGFAFSKGGKMITPLGAELVVSAAVPAGKIIGVDSSCALELVEAGGVMTEYDKLIDRQLERAAITCISGFSKIFTDASRALIYGDNG